MEKREKSKIIKFDLEKDRDILSHLQGQRNATRYIKDLIRSDIALDRQNDKATPLPEGKVRLETTVSESLADAALAIYSKLGIDMNTAIKLMLMATIRDNGLPFTLTLDKENQPER